MARKKTCTVTQIHDIAHFQQLADEAIATLPQNLKSHVEKLVIRVENFPSQSVLDELTLQDKYDLLGLYKGIPLPSKQKNSAAGLPDVIFLYRAPLIMHAREHKESLDKLVYHVIIHEIGHHFGFTEQDMSWIQHYSNGLGEKI